MVNKNNSYCFKWSSIQLLLHSKFNHFFTFFFSHLSSNVIEDFWETYCNWWDFVASPAAEKGLSWIRAMLYCSGTGCDLRDSNQRNPPSNSQWHTALGINQHRLGNSAFQHQLKPNYIWGIGSSESQYSSLCVNYTKIAPFDLISSLN